MTMRRFARLRSASLASSFALALAAALAGCGEEAAESAPATGGGPVGCSGPPPTALPFESTRPAAGEPPTAAEVAAFTKTLTAFWKSADYFRWYARFAHGLDESYAADMPAYGLAWQDTRAIKAGDTVTLRHEGGADNLMIRTSKVLTSAAAGYLATGDPMMRRLVEQYSKGIVALFKGMSWKGQDPPVESIMARAIFTHDHEYTWDDRKVKVEYGPMKGASCTADEECPGDGHAGCAKNPKEGSCCVEGACVTLDWNSHTVPNPDNPFYGDIWIRNMRSKDDVPHIFRSFPVLVRVANEAADESTRAAAADAALHLEGFANDIVENGYKIRTIEWGEAYVPTEDLASFVQFEVVVPNGECDAKLSSALIATGGALDNDCGNGISPPYEEIATSIHYYNAAIIRYFHLSAITTALVRCQDDTARALLEGLAERADLIESDTEYAPTEPSWVPDMAGFLVAAGASGLALTGDEARIIQEEYARSAEAFAAWPKWDLWSPSVADGEHEYEPPRDTDTGRAVEIEEMGYLVEYCASPWKNPASAPVVDCDIVLDPARWGE